VLAHPPTGRLVPASWRCRLLALGAPGSRYAEIAYGRFRDQNLLDRHLAGLADTLVRHQGPVQHELPVRVATLFRKQPGPGELSEAMIEGWIAVPSANWPILIHA
jgi:hypothetical protein